MGNLQKWKKSLGTLLIGAVLSVGLGGSWMAVDAPSAEAAKHKKMKMKVEEVQAKPTEHWSEERLLKLVPELEHKEVDVKRLSHEIQMVNDSEAVKLNADFQKQAGDSYKVSLTAEEKKETSTNVGVGNTGNEYTGEWRLGVTYIDKNFTGSSDSLGVAYVTSPGHWDDVKQAAVAYRAILPKAGDSLYVTYSWSDVDLGTIGNFGGVGVEATGKGQTLGTHYQHNITYSTARKQIVDVGVDYKNYNNATVYDYAGAVINNNLDYEEALASVTYVDVQRTQNDAFAWSVGYTRNLHGDDGFRRNRPNSDSNFNLWKASISYQHRFPGDWIAGIRANGQYTRDNVITTEQFGAGGFGTVRGFKERTAYADKGWMGSVEVYTPEFMKNSRIVLFTDYAHLSNNNPNLGELSSDSIGSYGIGYRYYDKKSTLSVSVDYARAYKNLDNVQGNHRPWHVMVNMSF